MCRYQIAEWPFLLGSHCDNASYHNFLLKPIMRALPHTLYINNTIAVYNNSLLPSSNERP